MLNIIALLALLIVTPAYSAEGGGTCNASNLNEINNCINIGSAVVNITQDITCTSGDCTIKIVDKDCVTLDGNGHEFTRKTSDKTSPTLLIQRSDDIRVTDIKFTDSTGWDSSIDLYVRTLFVYDSTAIFFDNVHIDRSRSYALVLQKSANFTLQNSRITNSGVLGFYIGYRGSANTDATKNVTIKNNIFANNSTNGLAVHGLEGTNNVISDNFFTLNHWYGRFKNGNHFWGGGQVYLGDATNLEFVRNEIRHGHCYNCSDVNIDNNVHGIELGELNTHTLKNTLIANNILVDNTNCAVLKNPSATIDSTVVITENTFYKNRCDILASGASIYNNIFK